MPRIPRHPSRSYARAQALAAPATARWRRWGLLLLLGGAALASLGELARHMAAP